MKSNIFIPKKINVGFQERKDTYTGKLAYVIYYDEKGKLRKEKSWNGWRDQNISNEEFDNVPTEGFVLNKKVGGVEESYYDVRKTYVRVYDPRGFEFEITIPNLLWILENNNSVVGKGLEGNFVYGWNGTELLLVPTDSPDYKEIIDYNKLIHENNFIKGKDLVVGATYLGKDDKEYVYMGRFDYYDRGYWKNNKFFKSHKTMENYCVKNNIPPTKVKSRYWGTTERYEEDKYDYGKYNRRYCFCCKNKNYKDEEYTSFTWKNSLDKFLISVIDLSPNENYADYFELLEGTSCYSPVDSSKDTYHELTYEEFISITKNPYSYYFYGTGFFSYVGENNKEIKRYHVKCNDYYTTNENEKKFIIQNDKYEEVLNIFPIENKSIYGWSTNIHMIPVTLKEVYDKMKPMYKQTYLANGRKYNKTYE